MALDFHKCLQIEAEECAKIVESAIVQPPSGDAPAGSYCVEVLTKDEPAKILGVVITPHDGAKTVCPDGTVLVADCLHSILMLASPAYNRDYFAAVAAKLLMSRSDTESSDDDSR